MDQVIGIRNGAAVERIVAAAREGRERAIGLAGALDGLSVPELLLVALLDSDELGVLPEGLEGRGLFFAAGAPVAFGWCRDGARRAAADLALSQRLLSDNTRHLWLRRLPLADQASTERLARFADLVRDRLPQRLHERVLISAGSVLYRYGLRTTSDVDVVVSLAGLDGGDADLLADFAAYIDGLPSHDSGIVERWTDTAAGQMQAVLAQHLGGERRLCEIVLHPRCYFYGEDGLKYLALPVELGRRVQKLRPRLCADVIAARVLLGVDGPDLPELPELITRRKVSHKHGVTENRWTRKEFFDSVFFNLCYVYNLKLTRRELEAFFPGY